LNGKKGWLSGFRDTRRAREKQSQNPQP